MKNIAYIDWQNVHLGIKNLGWIVDRNKFLIYLKKKYEIHNAKMFLWYISKYENFYDKLKWLWYELVFRKVSDGKIVKWNIDSHLVMQSIIDYYENQLNKFFLVSWDWDFDVLVEFFKNKNKLWKLLLPNAKKCSKLLKKCAWWFSQDLTSVKDYICK